MTSIGLNTARQNPARSSQSDSQSESRAGLNNQWHFVVRDDAPETRTHKLIADEVHDRIGVIHAQNLRENTPAVAR